MCKLVETKYVIQQYPVFQEDWVDSYVSSFSNLKKAQKLLKTVPYYIEAEAKKRGVRYRIVKRTTYEEEVK